MLKQIVEKFKKKKIIFLLRYGNTVALLPYKFASISPVCFVLPGSNMSQLDDRHVLPAVEMS